MTQFSPDWYRHATRWTQLTFTDDDPGRYDIEFWTDVMRRTRSNALCLSAGGYMAFYPTQIEFHHRSAYLGDSDPFGDLVSVARSLDMYVMARVDPHAIHDDAAQAHPEWLARDADGNPLPHQSYPGLWQTDPFSTYNKEFITEVALEIVRNYDVDALFANRWEGPRQISYSEHAQRDFRDATGYNLPRPDETDADVWAAYRQWRSQRLSELVVLWDDAVRAVRPHVRFIPNRGETLTRDLVPELIESRYPIFFVDKQGRDATEPLWASGRIGKRARGLYPERPVALISSVGPEFGDVRWKDSVTNPHELVTWICDGFAHGALPWFTKFKAECFDTRWVAPMERAFTLHATVEPVYQDLQPTAEVAILDTGHQAGGDADPFKSYRKNSADEDGFCQALVEARVPFEYVASEALSIERLQSFRVLVVPNASHLSPDQVTTIKQYVDGGGSIVAAHHIATESTAANPVLEELLGVTASTPARGPVKNNYIQFDADHPIADGYEGASRIVGGTMLVGVEAADGADSVFEFLPDYPDLPMEEVYPRPGEPTPAVVARTHDSGGRSVYVAFNLGEIFAQKLQSDHGQLITNAVAWAAGDEAPAVAVQGPGLADVAVRSSADAIAVTVVNLNNSQAMRGQNRETIPLPPQDVSVTVPDGFTTATARLVVADEDVPVTIDGGRAHVRLAGVEYLEVVHLSWS